MLPLATALLIHSGGPRFEVDLFLVGAPPPADMIAWVEGKQDTQLAASLRATLAEYEARERSYVVLFRPDPDLFMRRDDTWKPAMLQRDFSSYDSATESVTVNGKTKTRVIGRTKTTSTYTTSVHARRLGAGPYISQVFSHFGEGESRTAIRWEDPNSYLTATRSKNSTDHSYDRYAILLSPESIRSTRRFFEEGRAKAPGLCICAWGLPQRDAPGFVSFPGDGQVTHLRLGREPDGWSARVERILR